MKRLVRHLVNAIAPEACPFCDGGSGSVLDRETGRLRQCDRCDGTGLATNGERARAETLVKGTIDHGKAEASAGD